MKLWEIAHSRTGDKGNIANISLIVYEASDFDLVKEKVTAQVVKKWFGNRIKGKVERYELEQLGALNFVLHQALDGGVTCSTNIDKHGKTLGSYLLEMEI